MGAGPRPGNAHAVYVSSQLPWEVSRVEVVLAATEGACTADWTGVGPGRCAGHTVAV